MALEMEGLVREWINSRTDLVGSGKPITRGAHLKRLRSQGVYVFLLAVGTPVQLTAETPIGRARISATIYAATKQASANAATAYASVLESMNGAPDSFGSSYKLLLVDSISGPLALDDTLTTREEFRYQVDADFYITG